MKSKINSRGQVTIPKAIRERLGLKPGDRVKLFAHPDGNAVLLPVRPASFLRGMLKPRGKRVTIQDMADAAAEGGADVSRWRKK